MNNYGTTQEVDREPELGLIEKMRIKIEIRIEPVLSDIRTSIRKRPVVWLIVAYCVGNLIGC